MEVILVGFMGSGKTTVGKLLAKRLNSPYHDLDDVIVENADKSISDIFADSGEDIFRNMEHDALRGAIDDAGILGTGGGAPIQQRNYDLLKQTDVPVVLLDVLPETIMHRLKGDDGRPLVKRLGHDGLVALKGDRDSKYIGVSDFRVSTDDLTPNEVVDIILKYLNKRAKNHNV